MVEYIAVEKPVSIRVWVEKSFEMRIREAARDAGIDRLKPVFLALNEQVDYDAIRIVLAKMRNET